MVQCGAVVVIECFSERLDPALNPLLEIKRQTAKWDSMGTSIGNEAAQESSPFLHEDSSQTVTLGSAHVDMHPMFRLLLKTPLNAPHFPPEVCSRLTLVDFSVGSKGLEQRLLRLALQAAAPDIHATCLRLVHEGAETRAQLIAAEHRMLEALSEASVGLHFPLEV